ncbi:MAG: helix-turn-helix domain-containing protein [Pseudomonadales bacterium]
MTKIAADSLFTPEQVADRLGLHVRTVRRYIREGRLSAVRLGRRYRVTRAALEAFAGITPDPATPTGRPVADVSIVIGIDDLDHEAVERLTTHVMASVSGRRDRTTPVRVDASHDPERRRLKLIVSGDLAAAMSMLALVNALLGDIR